MIWIFASMGIMAIMFLGLGVVEGEYEMEWKRNKKQWFCVLALLIMVPAFVVKIPANSVGIRYSAFTGTSDVTLSEGYKIKSPFDNIYKISTEVQTISVENLTAQTKDAQYVTSTLDIKYRVNPSNAHIVFSQFRNLENVSNNLIAPTTQRVLELITTKHNVIDVLGEKRTDIYSELSSALTYELTKYGVDFYSISISDMDAGDAIEAAITKEAVAKKEVETAEQELLKAETQAKQKSVTAKAEQEAAKIIAETKIIEAEATKKANELLQESLTKDILAQQWIEKWNGETPVYYGGNGTDLIFNAGDVK